TGLPANRDRRQPSAQHDVHDGGALRGAATRDDVETSLVRGGEAPRALGDVESDGDAGPVELVAEAGMPPLGKQAGGSRLKLDGEPVAVKLLGVEQRLTGEERSDGR